MKHAIGVRLAICVASLVLGGSVAAAPAPWLSDSFDSYTAQGLSGEAGWVGGDVIKVKAAPGKRGKSATMSYILWGAGETRKQVSSGPGLHYIDFDVAMDTDGAASAGDNLGYISFLGPKGVEITRFYFSRGQFKVLLAPQNQVVVLDRVANQSWHHVRLGINLPAAKLDVWIDGEQKVSGGDIYQRADSIESVAVGQWDKGSAYSKSDTYVANLSGSQAASLPMGSATKIFSPRWFPGPECNNVCFPFVIYDDATSSYKMYYTGSNSAQQNDSAWDQWQTNMGTSPDAVTWSHKDDNYQAVLYAKKYLEGEIMDPEVLTGIFDSVFAIGACAIKDGSTYKMWYTGWNGDFDHMGGGISTKTNFRIGYATSTDGIEWTKYSGAAGAGSVLGLGAVGQQDAKGVGQPYVIKEGSNYRMWYEGFDGARWRIFYATSTNGTTWTRQGLALNVGAGGSTDELGVRNPVVIWRAGQYELWYQGQSVSAPNYHVLRATSSNGLTWTKIGTQVTLHPDDALDGSEMIHVDSAIVNLDNTVQVFFGKQNTTTQAATYATIYNKNYYIYTEVVNP